MQHSKNVVVPITTAILLLLSAICSLGQRDPSGRAEAPAKPTNETVAEKVPKGEETDKFGIYINTRPLKDFAKEALAKIDANEIRLDSNFKVAIAGSLGLGRDGKTIVLKNPNPVASWSPEVNDPAMVSLVQDAILAVGDA